MSLLVAPNLPAILVAVVVVVVVGCPNTFLVDY